MDEGRATVRKGRPPDRMPWTMDHDEHHRRSRRAAWWLAAGVTLAVLMVLLVLWLPFYRVHALAQEFRDRGGIVVTQSAAPPWLESASAVLEKLGFVRIVGADLRQADVTDDDVLVLTQLRTLHAVSLSGRKVSVERLFDLAVTPGMEDFSVIDCSDWTTALSDEVKRRNPAVDLTIRGPAFLGIVGTHDKKGCGVGYVGLGSPAHRAGIASGDVITAIDGAVVPDFETLVVLIGRHASGDEVKVEYLRGNETATVTCRLQAWREAPPE